MTASAPQSGSYAESVSYETLGTPGARDDINAFSLETQLQLVMQITAWQKVYGNLYAAPSEIYSGQQAVINIGDDPTTVDNYHAFMAKVACEVAVRDFFSRF